VNDAQTGIIESPLYHDGTQRENADYYLFVWISLRCGFLVFCAFEEL
jgi:hypothetical protein